METNAYQLDNITQISHSIEKLAEAVKSFDIARYSCFKAPHLLDTLAKKIEFIIMIPEERYDWITYELGET